MHEMIVTNDLLASNWKKLKGLNRLDSRQPGRKTNSNLKSKGTEVTKVGRQKICKCRLKNKPKCLLYWLRETGVVMLYEHRSCAKC